MDRKQLLDELRYMTVGRFNDKMKDKEFACELVQAFIKEVSNYSKIDMYTLCDMASNKNNEHVQNCTESSVDVQNCTEVKKYTNGLTDEQYAEIDKMLREEYKIRVISEKTGVHRNTISKRRKMLGL